MPLELRLGDRDDLEWAQRIVAKYHYLHRRVDPRARPMAYIVRHTEDSWQRPLGLVMLGIPHATKCGGWWGYEGLPTQWQVVDLCRIWLDPEIQAGGHFCDWHTVPGFRDRRGKWRPAVATWAIRETLVRVQRDRVSLWPPVLPERPYHILLAISYHDPRYHNGTIYRQSKAAAMYTDDAGNAVPGPSGKFGWCWRLPMPGWSWHDITVSPRNLRFDY